jgi:hypothetical protein
MTKFILNEGGSRVPPVDGLTLRAGKKVMPLVVVIMVVNMKKLAMVRKNIRRSLKKRNP